MPPPTITPDLLAQARGGDCNPLAAAVLAVLQWALSSRRIPPPDVEDLCQQKVLKILENLIEKRVDSGKEDAYVWRCGETTAISYFRKKNIRFVPLEDSPHDPQEPASEEDAQAQEDHLQRQIEELRKVLAGEELSPADRRLLWRVYVEEVPMKDLIKEELDENPTIRRGPKTGLPRTPEQARNSVDQRLTRARQRLSVILQRRRS
jgi:DNA-directed RNA polymerase specialized sigma24 family protein